MLGEDANPEAKEVSEQQGALAALAILKLPIRAYYGSNELSQVFCVSRVTVQRAAKKHNIGRIMKCERGGRGVRIFTPEDFVKLSHKIRHKFPGKGRIR